MKTINEHIKKSEYVPFYLLYGEEDYLKKQSKEKLLAALVSPGDTMNCNIYQGNKVNPSEILDMAETLPFFAEKRVIVLDETGLGEKADDDFLKRLETLPDTTVMIFLEQKINKRSKIYKFIKKNGYPAEMSTQDEKQLIVWVGALLKKEGKRIRKNDVVYFLHKVGTDMNMIRNEVTKLSLYAAGRSEITTADIDAVCTEEITGKIFDMIEAIGLQQQKKALNLYYQLLELKEPPLRILALVARQCNQMLMVKSFAAFEPQNKIIAQKAGIHPFVVGKLRNQVRNFTMDQLQDFVKECAAMEEGIKTGIYNDRIGVELLIIAFSQKQ